MHAFVEEEKYGLSIIKACGSMDQTLKDTGLHIHPQKEEPYVDWAIESYGTDGTAVDGLTPETLPSGGQHTTSVNEAQTTASNEGQRIAASDGQKTAASEGQTTAVGEAQRTTKFQEGDTGQPDPSDKNTRHSTSGNDGQRQGAADAGGTSDTHVQKPGMAYELRPASPIQDDESTPESRSFLSSVGKCFGKCLHCYKEEERDRPLEPATIRNEEGGKGGIRMETLFPNNPQPNNPRPEKQKKQWPSSWTSNTWSDCFQRGCPCCCCLFCLCPNDSEADVGSD